MTEFYERKVGEFEQRDKARKEKPQKIFKRRFMIEMKLGIIQQALQSTLVSDTGARRLESSLL